MPSAPDHPTRRPRRHARRAHRSRLSPFAPLARRAAVSLCAALAGLVALPACSTDDDAPLTIVLVTLDTTRADHLGAYGHASARTPRLDALAKRGLVFDRAYATAPLTLPSHASMLSGVQPVAHGLRDNTGFALSDDGRLVTEALAERGWRTGAFVGSFVLDARFGLDQGFEVYDGPRPLNGTAQAEEVMRSADVVVGAASRWIANLDPRDQAFLWVHMYDPHQPYAPPSRFASLHPYDGEIAFCDEQLGALTDALRRAGRSERLALVITADHGESMGQHGEATHGIFLYDGAARVPLIIAAPGVTPGRRDAPVSVTSIGPTLLALAGLDADAIAAELPASLAPSLLDPQRTAGEPVLMEALLPFYAHGWHPLRSLVWNDHKLIEGRRTELYALDDTGESRDLSAEQTQLRDDMLGALHDQLARRPALGWAADAGLDTVDRARLAELGYLSVAGADDDLFGRDLPDPVSRIGDLDLREEGLTLMTQAKALGPEAGAGMMRQARVKFLRWKNAAKPPSPQSLQLLSEVEIALGDYAAAARLLEEHAERRPTIALTRFNLAVCRFQLGEVERAAEEMMNAVGLDPAFPEPYRWLMTTHRQQGELGAAAWWYRQLDRNWHGPPGERQQLQSAIAILERDAAARGQPVEPPPGVPAALLTPDADASR